jgi:hypothetical protein
MGGGEHMENRLTCCFSGRFDRPHIGHCIQIMRLGQRFKKVIVPVLDYGAQKYAVSYRVQILRSALQYAIGEYNIFATDIHFGEAPEHRIRTIPFDVYVSQNTVCLKHIESMGFRVEYVDRAFDYSASEEYLSVKLKS